MRFGITGLCIAFWAVLALLATGCSKQKLPSDLPKLFPTQIVLTQDGKPLEKASVTLTASDPEAAGAVSKWASSGGTDAMGLAEMFVNGQYKGVPEGKFKVVVLKYEDSSVQAKEIPPQPNAVEDPEGFDKWRKMYDKSSEQMDNKIYYLVDKKYSDEKSTPLEITVTQAGPNKFQFDLGKPVRILFKR